MKNPWKEIKLFDYEEHMKLDSVMQLQVLNHMMKEQFNEYVVKSIMILGIAGGNGLNHINPKKIEKVYGVDINTEYLNECAKRYPQLENILELLCIDLSNDVPMLPHADLVVANLLIEYVGYSCFKEVILQMEPQYMSCVIQINTENSFVSDSPYLHSFDDLYIVHHQIDENGLCNAMNDINYHMILRNEDFLINGKKFLRLDFKFCIDK